MFIVRPDVWAASLPDYLDELTLREYVQLAKHKAKPGSNRQDDLQQVLRMLDEHETVEAREFACCEMNEDESMLPRASLDGFHFSVKSLRDWRRQGQLVSAAYRGSLQSVGNMLRVEGVAEVNPLTSRSICGFVHHPRVARWPLRAPLPACAEASPDGNLKDSMQNVRRIRLDWEPDLVWNFHLSDNMLSEQTRARLDIFLAGYSSLESVPDP